MISFDKNDFFLVTGGSSGIGESIVNNIANHGGKVIAVSSSLNKLRAMKSRSLFSEKIFVEQYDLTDIEGIQKFIAYLVEKYGKIKSFIHAAGILKTIPFTSKKNNDMNMFKVNYFSGVEIARMFINKKINSGNNSSIVFISSIASVQAFPGAVTYSATKGAINSFVKSLAAEIARRKIRVNSILPGFVKTEMLDELKPLYGDSYIKELHSKYPLGLGDPEDVANTVTFLLSDQAKWITGSCIKVDGGGSL